MTNPTHLDREQIEAQLRYRVVVNRDGQYALLLFEQPLPAGWRDAGERGSKAVCLEFIRLVWSDMRPASIRQPSPSSNQTQPPASPPAPHPDPAERPADHLHSNPPNPL